MQLDYDIQGTVPRRGERANVYNTSVRTRIGGLLQMAWHRRAAKHVAGEGEIDKPESFDLPATKKAQRAPTNYLDKNMYNTCTI